MGFFRPTRGSLNKKKNLMDSHPYSYKTSILTLGVPYEVVHSRQTKLHPGFTLHALGPRQTSADFPRYLNSSPVPV